MFNISAEVLNQYKSIARQYAYFYKLFHVSICRKITGKCSEWKLQQNFKQIASYLDKMGIVMIPNLHEVFLFPQKKFK